jgi:nucleoside-diphosphate-sugar epimerase
MKIGIIGCGYVGSATARALKADGHHISVTTRNPHRIAELQSISHEIFPIDIDSPSYFRDFLRQQEVVILTVAPLRGTDYASTYLKTAQQVVHEMPSTLQQLIYTSSTSVYGECGGSWVNETTHPNPSNPSTQVLLDTENHLLRAPTNVCILRLSEIYGPGRPFESHVTSRTTFPGTGNNFTNLIHLEDIVAALRFAIQRKLVGIYNLSSDFHPTRKELYDTISDRLGLQRVNWDPSIKSIHGGNKRVDATKIKTLGFKINHQSL